LKRLNEVRDPVHAFARYDNDERRVIDSRPVQRLRNIRQLAMSFLVYPGATHSRFEHSIGVMELAGRVFDVITHPDNLSAEAKTIVPELGQTENLPWWRRVVRLAALCHDVGHLPFSHAAEHSLMPDGSTHETMTRVIVTSEHLAPLLSSFKPPITPELVAKIAVGQKHASDLPWSPWESILSEVIVDDAFGVDRMDYLLRDSLHVGVGYGSFDHYRLIDTLRVVVPVAGEGKELGEPQLGVEFGGLHSAAALLLARFFMFSQVYFHAVRVVYDLHLVDFLAAWLEGGRLPADVGRYLALTDNEVMAAIFRLRDEDSVVGEYAKRLADRGHFRVLYQLHPADRSLSVTPAQVIFDAAKAEFGEENVKHWGRADEAGAVVFPVLMRDGSVVSSVEAMEALNKVPAVRQDYVFISPAKREAARKWLAEKKAEILSAPPGVGTEGRGG
jgi:HD superfamily phosphohydrolase